jgi:hypothetical protein
MHQDQQLTGRESSNALDDSVVFTAVDPDAGRGEITALHRSKQPRGIKL